MITVQLTTEQWAGVIRLMKEGQAEGWCYEGKYVETDALIDAICQQTKISRTKADEMEPERHEYVSTGDAT